MNHAMDGVIAKLQARVKELETELEAERDADCPHCGVAIYKYTKRDKPTVLSKKED